MQTRSKRKNPDVYSWLLTTRTLWLWLVLVVVTLGGGWWLRRGEDAEATRDAAAALGLMWQVHASFVSIGFAGLAIAFQLLSAPPLALGSARRLVVAHVRFARMLVLGVGSDLIIGAAALAVPNRISVWAVLVAVVVPSLLTIALAYWRMADLYRAPRMIESLTLDNLKREVDKAAEAKDMAGNRAASFRSKLDPSRGLFPVTERPMTDSRLSRAVTYDGSPGILTPSVVPLAHAMSSLDEASRIDGKLTGMAMPSIYVAARPGQSVRPGDLLAYIHHASNAATSWLTNAERDIRAAFPAVSEDPNDPAVMVLSEADSLQDTITEAIANGLAQRAATGYGYYRDILSYLRAAKDPEPDFYSRIRDRVRDQIFTLDTVAAQREPRLASTATAAAYRRAKDAFRAVDLPGLATALRSYSHIWQTLVETEAQDSIVRGARDNLLTSMHGLTEFIIPHGHSSSAFSRRAADEAVWTFVEIVKHSLDTPHLTEFATAFAYHANLFTYGRDEMRALRPNITGGTVALIAWVLHGTTETGSSTVNTIVDESPKAGKAVDLYAVVDSLGRNTSYGRWHEWERVGKLPIKAHQAELDNFAAHATLILLAADRITKPDTPADSEQAQSLRWLQNHLTEARDVWDLDLHREPADFEQIAKHIGRALQAWDDAAAAALRAAPLDQSRVDAFRTRLLRSLSRRVSLASLLAPDEPVETPEGAIEDLSFELSVPKDYFVELSNVYSNPERLAARLASGLTENVNTTILGKLDPIPHQQCDLNDLASHLTALVDGMDDPLLILPTGTQIEDHLGLTPLPEADADLDPQEAGNDGIVADTSGVDRQTVTLGSKTIAAHAAFVPEFDSTVVLLDRTHGPAADLGPLTELTIDPVQDGTPRVAITGRQSLRLTMPITATIIRIRVEGLEW
ncbi:hypothetical protein AB0L64_06110 [Kribbella sp. NPDC051936]|uniref:hypothetical protein n=1 Tax=Kribbella sp. NPDC051936 TaxID=3154946 RepID=UPI0034493194